MSRQLFGTDGLRGRANVFPMTADFLMRLAMAAAQQFQRGDHHHCVVIGKDTRASGYMLESALTAGFVSMGMDVILLGPLPTPAVAMLTRSLRADLGVIISASHNPFYDNGVKFFGPDGFKLSDDEEKELEDRIEKNNITYPENLGKAHRLDDAAGRYIEFVKGTFPRGMRLDGLKIVVDCAHGAAYKVAPRILWELGAEVVSIGVTPDGLNINDGCGATDLAALKEAVVAHQADVGLALDGDADRLMVVDQTGATLDGDQLLGLIATSWAEDGDLRGNAIVTTHMSNLGLERYLESQGLGLIRTAVGDRYVLSAMRENGCNVGGEQSGHIILRDYTTTGDGLIAALQVLSIMIQKQMTAVDVGNIFKPTPQILRNLKVPDLSILKVPKIQEIIAEADNNLSNRKGKLLIRRSGTEPLIRIMAQGDDAIELKKIVDKISESIQNHVINATP